jgi:light-regulated signal transduction histidine kinase (bacteriophytochrome)
METDILKMNSRLEEKVKQRTLQLEQTITEMEAFSYSVSHDLRSPLRGINGWSMALLEDYDKVLDKTGKEYINRVISESQRMGQIIDSQLQLARITRTRLNMKKHNLSSQALEITQQLLRVHSQRMIEFQIQENVEAFSDRNTMNIVLTNLLDNACKFTAMRDKALICFGSKRLDNKNVYYVSDNGVGFSMNKAGKLFSAFQRLHKASEFPGSGIGLATVKRIINRYGGEIWAESRPDAGSTFYFTLGEQDNR